MKKIELIKLITETTPDYLDFLPGDVRKEIDELKVKIDAVYENSNQAKVF